MASEAVWAWVWEWAWDAVVSDHPVCEAALAHPASEVDSEVVEEALAVRADSVTADHPWAAAETLPTTCMPTTMDLKAARKTELPEVPPRVPV